MRTAKKRKWWFWPLFSNSNAQQCPLAWRMMENNQLIVHFRRVEICGSSTGRDSSMLRFHQLWWAIEKADGFWRWVLPTSGRWRRSWPNKNSGFAHWSRVLVHRNYWRGSPRWPICLCGLRRVPAIPRIVRCSHIWKRRWRRGYICQRSLRSWWFFRQYHQV